MRHDFHDFSKKNNEIHGSADLCLNEFVKKKKSDSADLCLNEFVKKKKSHWMKPYFP